MTYSNSSGNASSGINSDDSYTGGDTSNSSDDTSSSNNSSSRDRQPYTGTSEQGGSYTVRPENREGYAFNSKNNFAFVKEFGGKIEDPSHPYFVRNIEDSIAHLPTALARQNYKRAAYGDNLPAGFSDDILDDLVDQLPPELIDKVNEIYECNEYKPIQLQEGVKIHDPADINKDEFGNLLPQFGACPDLEFVHDSGWQWEDARTGEFTGAVPGGVKWFRSADIGPPKMTDATDTHNPGRIMNLPQDAVTMIHNEPNKLLWIHPYLERGESGYKFIKVPEESEEEKVECTEDGDCPEGYECNEDTGFCVQENVQTLAFSFYNQNWKWQSGPVGNSPTNSDTELNSGYWTSAGGLNSIGENDETRMWFDRSYQNMYVSGFRLGYSRGADTVLYGDSPTEGLEYGVVGFSGYISALPNDTHEYYSYNSGIQHAYTINRLCTTADELMYNMTKMVEWLQGFLEMLDDLGDDLPLPPGFPPDGNSYSLDPDDVLRTIGIPEEGTDFTYEEKRKILAFADRFGKLADKAREKDEAGAVAMFDCSNLIKKGFIDKYKNQPLVLEAGDEAAISLYYEIAGRVDPANAGLKESEMHFDVHPDELFERVKKGESLTKLDVFRNFFTRVVLRNERLARQIGDFDLEKFGRYSLGEIDDYEVKNEKFLMFLLNNEKGNIQDLKYEHGDILTVTLRSGFQWNSHDYLAGVSGFVDASDRQGLSIYAADGVVYSGFIDANMNMSQPMAWFEDFEDEFPRIVDGAWRDAERSENLEGDLTTNRERELSDKTRLLNQENTGTGVNKYATPGNAYDTWRPVDNPSHPDYNIERQYQRWDGGYCYPVKGESGLAQPSWDRWADAGKSGTVGKHSWDCKDDPDDIWHVHTYGPFQDHEKRAYYNFMIPLGRHEEPTRMDYGVAFWWAWKPNDRQKDWVMAKGGAKMPLDAYDPRMRPETKAEVKQNSPYSQRAYYRMKPYRDYFRVSCFQWTIPRGMGVPGADWLSQNGWDEIPDLPLLPDGSGNDGWKARKGPKITSNLWPSKKCGPPEPGTNKGDHPNGIWLKFVVCVAKNKNPWDEVGPDTNMRGPVYWTNQEHKVANLANEYWEQPVTILSPFPNSGYYKITPKEKLDKWAEYDKYRTPQMSIHSSPLGPQKCQDPLGNPGQRATYSAALTHLREHHRILYIDKKLGFSVAGWYPDGEQGPMDTGRYSYSQWCFRGEPWVTVDPVPNKEANNGPCYVGFLKKGVARPVFNHPYWQTALNFFGDQHNFYQVSKNITNVKPQPGKRLMITAHPKGTLSTNPVTNEAYDYTTNGFFDIYFCLNPLAADIGHHPETMLMPDKKWGYAGRVATATPGVNPNTPGLPVYVSVPSDKMIFQQVNLKNEFNAPVEMTEWNVDGQPAHVKLTHAEHPRDEAYTGCAFWTGAKTYKDHKVVGENGYVDFHDMFWQNPLKCYNDTVELAKKVKVGRDYTIVYTPQEIDTAKTAQWFKPENHRIRIIFGRSGQSRNPLYEFDPGFTETAEKVYLNEFEYEYTDIVCKPGVETTFEAKSEYLFFGCFNVTNDSMGHKHDWSRHGQGIKVEIKEKEYKPGCSLFASGSGVDPIPNGDPRTFANLNHYTIKPYMHLQQEISHYRHYEDEATGHLYDGGSVVLRAGRKYKLETTTLTPVGLQYRLFFVHPESALRDRDFTKNRVNEEQNETRYISRTSNQPAGKGSLEFVAESDILMLEAWNCIDQVTGEPRTQQSWSKKGEPAFLKLSYSDEGTIEASQYWTDVNGNSAQQASALKNSHWDDPLNKLFLLGPKYEGQTQKKINIKPNSKYQIEVVDRDDNPDYLHKIWIGPISAGDRPGVPCNYTSGPTVRKGQAAVFKTGSKNYCVILGCSETNRQITSWNKKGEPLFIKLKELPQDPLMGPVYMSTLYETDPTKWNTYQTELVDKYGFNHMFAQPDLKVFSEDYMNNNPDANPDTDDMTEEDAHFTKIHTVGEAPTDKTIRLEPGERYRLSVRPGLLQDECKPEDEYDLIPYVLRPFYAKDESQLDVTNYEMGILDTEEERAFFPQWHTNPNGDAKWPCMTGSYFDFVPKTRHTIFGAARLGGRLLHEWSRKGEPLHIDIEKLPDAPPGPCYWSGNTKDDLANPPLIAHPHFLKPINIHKLEADTEYEVKGLYEEFTGNLGVWWVFQQVSADNRIFPSATHEDVNCLFTLQHDHPEDMVLINQVTGREGFLWTNNYSYGGVIEHDAVDFGDSHYLKTPTDTQTHKFMGAIYSIYKPPGPPRPDESSADVDQTATIISIPNPTESVFDWGRNGEILPFEVKVRETPAGFGPVYWGDTKISANTGRAVPEFDNKYFNAPLNYTQIKYEKPYAITQRNFDGDWSKYTEVHLYAFNPHDFNVLDPSQNSLIQFRYIATYKNTDDVVYFYSGEDDYAIIASAVKMRNSSTRLGDWSPKGEKEPYVISERFEPEGPVYWADGRDNNGVDPDQWQFGMPNFGNKKWKGGINTILLEEGAAYTLKVKTSVPGNNVLHDYHVWFANDPAALKPSTSREGMWKQSGDLPGKLSILGGQLNPGSEHDFLAVGKYMAFGATNTESARTFENWSARGEADCFTVIKNKFPKGPSYPSQITKHGHKVTDWEHKRWKTPLNFANPRKGIFDSSPGTYTMGVTYKFKVKESNLGPRHYNVWFATMTHTPGVGPNSDYTLTLAWGHKIKRAKETFSIRAQGQNMFLSFEPSTGTGHPSPQTASMSAWSPDGYPFRIKASYDWMAIFPPNWWKWLALLAGLLAALGAIYAYLMATAPLDVLLEMVDDQDNNEYPIKRWQTLKDDEGNDYGYGYPWHREVLYSKYSGPIGTEHDPEHGLPYCNYWWDTKPKYVSWTADPMARAWARIMKLRMNGYLFHLHRYHEGRHDDIIKDDYAGKHAITVANIAQTFGIGYSKLTVSSRFQYKKVFREYREWPLNGGTKGDKNIDRYNPFSYKGVKVIKVDSDTNKLKQRSEWHNKLQWFNADYAFIHFTKQDTMVYSKGNAKYKSAISITGKYSKLVKPIGKSYGPKAMFTSLGYGVKTDHYFDTKTSSHAYVWEVINGDSAMSVDNWPGIVDSAGLPTEANSSHFIPYIEFDMDVIGGNFQLNQVHVNMEYEFFGEIVRYQALKMVADSGYTMRDSFDNTSSRDNFSQGSKKKLRLTSTEPVPLGAWRFNSISFCFWIGTGKGDKGMVVKNLTAGCELVNLTEG